MTTPTPPPTAPAGRLANHDGTARHRFGLRIYFEDTDLSGVVYHANYLRYMERARSDMLRLAGIDSRTAFEAGEGAWAVTELSIKYHAPAKLDDELCVTSTVEAVRGASVTIAQTITRGDTVLTRGTVTAAFVSPAGRARRQPADWIARFQAIKDGQHHAIKDGQHHAIKDGQHHAIKDGQHHAIKDGPFRA
ncbi:MAG: YbgC/FadM family acyl-CoA thioesterase [Sphingopyxis sp.]